MDASERRSATEYLDHKTRLRDSLKHALEQCEKDQHLNVAVALSEAQWHALACLDFFLKGGSVRHVRLRLGAMLTGCQPMSHEEV